MDTLLKFLTAALPDDAGQRDAWRARRCRSCVLAVAVHGARTGAEAGALEAAPAARRAAVVTARGRSSTRFGVLSLADTYAIFLSAPLIVTALSVPHSRRARRLAAMARHRRRAVRRAGDAEAVGSSFMTLGALAAFVSAVTYAISVVTVRVLTQHGVQHAASCSGPMLIMTLVSHAARGAGLGGHSA